MPNKDENELIIAAMKIISDAGDARLSAKSALISVQKQDFEGAYDNIKKAKGQIVNAHKVQTEIIQNEARGEKYEYCMLFNHAQDTLMTINSEVDLVSTLIDTFKVYAEMIGEKNV